MVRCLGSKVGGRIKTVTEGKLLICCRLNYLVEVHHVSFLVGLLQGLSSEFFLEGIFPRVFSRGLFIEDLLSRVFSQVSFSMGLFPRGSFLVRFLQRVILRRSFTAGFFARAFS